MSQSADLEIQIGTDIYHMSTGTRGINHAYGLEFHKKTLILEGKNALDTIHRDANHWVLYIGITRVAFIAHMMVQELELQDHNLEQVTINIYATARD